MIGLRGIHKSYGGRALFAGFDCVLKRGETTVITGRSGSGKSTLLRCINLLESIDDGQILDVGSHFELLSRSEFYKEMVERQLLEDEIEVLS